MLVTFFCLFRFLNHLEEDSIGRIYANDLDMKYRVENGIKADNNIFKLLKKWFPALHTVHSMQKGVKGTSYNGVYWKVKEDEQIDFMALHKYIIPKEAMGLNCNGQCISFAIRSNIFSTILAYKYTIIYSLYISM